MTIFTAGIVTLVGAIAILLIAFWLIAGATPAEAPESVTSRLYKVRGRYFIVLMGVLAVVLGLTMSSLPYKRASAVEPEYFVPVTGRIWSWEIGPARDRDGIPLKNEGDGPHVPLGRPVEFQVTAMDVNHGFGIYDDSGRMVAQTQAMPGYVNSLVHTFTEPGTYHVLCLEFCGLAHHTMITTFIVD